MRPQRRTWDHRKIRDLQPGDVIAVADSAGRSRPETVSVLWLNLGTGWHVVATREGSLLLWPDNVPAWLFA